MIKCAKRKDIWETKKPTEDQAFRNMMAKANLEGLSFRGYLLDAKRKNSVKTLELSINRLLGLARPVSYGGLTFYYDSCYNALFVGRTTHNQ